MREQESNETPHSDQSTTAQKPDGCRTATSARNRRSRLPTRIRHGGRGAGEDRTIEHRANTQGDSRRRAGECLSPISGPARTVRSDSRPDPRPEYGDHPDRSPFRCENESRLLQFSNEAGKIRYLQHDAIPAARLLPPPIGHWPRARRARTAEQHLRVAERDVRERGELLVFQREPEVRV